MKIKFKLKKLARRKELIVIIWASVNSGFSGGSRSERKLTLRTLGVGSGFLFGSDGVELTDLFEGEELDVAGSEEVAATVAALVER